MRINLMVVIPRPSRPLQHSPLR